MCWLFFSIRCGIGRNILYLCTPQNLLMEDEITELLMGKKKRQNPENKREGVEETETCKQKTRAGTDVRWGLTGIAVAGSYSSTPPTARCYVSPISTSFHRLRDPRPLVTSRSCSARRRGPAKQLPAKLHHRRASPRAERARRGRGTGGGRACSAARDKGPSGRQQPASSPPPPPHTALGG